MRHTAILSLLLFAAWLAVVGGSYLLAPDSLLRLMESLISHDGQIDRFGATTLKLALAPGLALALFLFALDAARRYPAPGVVLALWPGWFVLYYLFYRWFVQNILKNGPTEDSLLEWGTFVFAMAAALVFLLLGLRGLRLGFLLAFAFFVFGGEEISWGDRVFDFRTPDFFAQNNIQSETNLHNFLNPAFGWLYVTVNFTAFLALTRARELPVLAALYRPEGMRLLLRASDRAALWLAPLLLALASVFPGDEYVEEQWSLIGFLLALLLWREHRRG